MVAPTSSCCRPLLLALSLWIVQVATASSSSHPSLRSRKLPSSGFVHTDGKKIVEGNGQEILLRGMGLGGWMVQEPYMMKVSDSAPGGQHDIFANIANVIGADNLQTYQNAWLDNYMSREDLKVLKLSGFNSVRIPIHYNLFTLPIQEEPTPGQDTWLNEGFGLLDRLIHWCEQEQVYVVIDLHAAPGGQGRDAAISDYDDSKPSLWEDPENVRKTVALWRKIANRYKNKEIIAGYDLLNEINWNFDGSHANGCSDNGNAPLKDFNDETIAAIRSVDTNHLIFVEGNCWANNHNGLWPIADHNIALSFHRYWDENNIESIQRFLDWRDQHNVPLWMGESGEHNQWWYQEAVNLLESHNIGWSWWAWKKMESDSGTFNIPKPDGYDDLVDFWAKGGNVPDRDRAFQIMMQVASNARVQHASKNYHSTNALTEKIRTCNGAPAVPLSTTETTLIEAEDNCQVHGVGLENTADSGGGVNIGWLDAGDYLSYNVDVPIAGTYEVGYRVAGFGDGGLQLMLQDNANTVIGTVNMPWTGGWQNWEVKRHQVQLPQGTHTIRIHITGSGWNFNWFQISYVP